MVKRSSVRILVLSATVLSALVAPQLASARSREEPISVKLVAMTQPLQTGCHGSTFAVVADLADAAEYHVTWTSTTAPGREYTLIFNRHERGNLQFTEFPTWSPGKGLVAGLLVGNSSDGPGTAEEDCTTVRAKHEANYAVVRATVIRYTPDVPKLKAPAYQLSSIAVTGRNDGPSGKDTCMVAHFVTFPAIPGALRYRITITDKITGVLRSYTKVVDAADVNPNPPAATKLRPYRKAGRIGHYLLASKVGRWGCTHAEWFVAERVMKVTVKAEKS